MEYNIACPLCNSTCTKETHLNCTIFECIECGRFQIHNQFLDSMNLTEKHKLVLRYYYKNLAPDDNRRLTVINSQNLDNIIESVYYPKNLVEKVDNVLAYFVNKTGAFGQIVPIQNEKQLQTQLFCSRAEELNNIITYLLHAKYLDVPIRTLTSPKEYFVTMEGFKYYQEYESRLLNNKNKTKQVFVAMWFNDKEDIERFRPNMQNVYEKAIQPAIEGKDGENKFISIKINNVEHNNDINDEMIAQIRKSRFMVADLTGYRGGVYWEAGFAYGLGMPVIYTCHEKWLKSNEDLNIEGVHFDLSHRNIILWDDTKEGLKNFQNDLRNRIEAIIV